MNASLFRGRSLGGQTVAVFAALTSGLLAAAPISSKNWKSHPAVVEVRQIVVAVDLAKKEKALKLEEGRSDCEGAEFFTAISVDQKGTARRLTAEWGGEDSACTVAATYDEQGTLRFLFIHAKATNGSALEQRFYWAADGAVVFKNEKPTGPGWTWWRPSRKALLQLKEPRAAFRAPCALMQE